MALNPNCRCIDCGRRYAQPHATYTWLACPICLPRDARFLRLKAEGKVEGTTDISHRISKNTSNDAKRPAYTERTTTTRPLTGGTSTARMGKAMTMTSNQPTITLPSSKTSKKAAPSNAAEITRLLAELKRETDPDRKKQLRRSLRSKGHTGGLGIRATTTRKGKAAKKVAKKASSKRKAARKAGPVALAQTGQSSRIPAKD